MIKQAELGNAAFSKMRRLKMLIDNGNIHLAGNSKLKIYGKLCCTSGKRIKTENRVFFQSEDEAITAGYRPCGNCMPDAYLRWKALS
jgi:methylphosphotriester-DNA--protein-cysteine methyltransferase